MTALAAGCIFFMTTLLKAAEFFGARALDGVTADDAPFMRQMYALGLRSADGGMSMSEGWEPFDAVIVSWQRALMRRWYVEGGLAAKRVQIDKENAVLASGRVQP